MTRDDTAPERATSEPPRDDGPSMRWLGATILIFSLIGFVPLDQALYRLGLSPSAREAFGWQMGTCLLWLAVARPIARRWSLVDSQPRALGGLALLTLATTVVNAAACYQIIRPPSPYPAFASRLELSLSMLPIHALTLCMISLVGSWSSARRQQERAADREALLSASAVRAELDVLRTRLQPHFLLNALNTVAGLARRHDGEGAADVAADLGELLRFSLAESSDAVSFDTEREMVERYLAIEQARLGDRLQVSWAIDPAARTTRVPALIWQPLVENAIRHGIARRLQSGRISLSAHRREQALHLVVDADGPDDAGIAVLDSPPPFGGLGLGLATVERRLALLYGTRGSVTRVARTGGTRTELIIPVARA